MATVTELETAPAPVNKVNNRKRGSVAKTILSILGGLVALGWAFPVYWMIQSSLASNRALTSNNIVLYPQEPSFDNYRSVITFYKADGTVGQKGEFVRALQVSLSLTVIAVSVALIFAFLAAIAISRFKFRGRKTFIFVILLVQMLPAEGLFIAQYKMLSAAGQRAEWLGIGSIGGISFFYIAAIVPFTIWMLRGFVAGVPADLEEAGMVDGLSRTQAFIRITLPLLAPGLIAAGVFGFIQSWNEYTLALVADVNSLAVWLGTFRSASQTVPVDYGHIMAASTLVAVPVIIFFMIVQGRMTAGLVAGAVKG